jgi:hypothetical protein
MKLLVTFAFVALCGFGRAEAFELRCLLKKDCPRGYIWMEWPACNCQVRCDVDRNCPSGKWDFIECKCVDDESSSVTVPPLNDCEAPESCPFEHIWWGQPICKCLHYCDYGLCSHGQYWESSQCGCAPKPSIPQTIAAPRECPTTKKCPPSYVWHDHPICSCQLICKTATKCPIWFRWDSVNCKCIKHTTTTTTRRPTFIFCPKVWPCPLGLHWSSHVCKCI